MASKNEFSIPQSWKRKSVLVGHDNSSIVKFLKVDKSWVWRVRKKHEKSKGDYEAIAQRSTHKQRSDSVRTPEFVAKVQKMIGIDPDKSIRSIARDLGRSESMIRTYVLEELRFKSYKMRKAS